MKIGYACINLTLAEQGIHVNRTLMKRTFQNKGPSYASKVALGNIRNFEKVVEWNINNGILLYRMSSDMFPWMSEYELKDLPDYGDIKSILARIGAKAKNESLRLTYHPGPFNVLASPDTSRVEKTQKELRQHGEIMDLIGLPRNPTAKINIHVGGAYGDKLAAMDRFITNFNALSPGAKSRLTIENDDKASMYSVRELTNIHNAIGIPIVFDYLHHQFCTGGLSEEDAIHLAFSTWPEGITPVVHYSSSKRRFEDPAVLATAHADYIYRRIETYGRELDIMLEAKAKEKAIMQYAEEFGNQ